MCHILPCPWMDLTAPDAPRQAEPEAELKEWSMTEGSIKLSDFGLGS